MKKACFLMMLLLAGIVMQAQQGFVSGTVTDSSDDPLPGVNVVIKGTTTGTITDVNGKFTIQVPAKNQMLSFSFIGFKPVDLDVAGKSSVTVKMESESVGLDEVVAIGYGTMKRRDLTGSVASVNMKDLGKAPMISFDAAIGGKVAGVMTTTADGQPGVETEIVIRGTNSITGSNNPLFVVDGFPMEDITYSSLNPADIASIEVLKDASATAIYGARGANGVILVTMKRGTEGIAKVQYDGYVSMANDVNRMELLSPYEFVKMQVEYYPSTSGNAYTTALDRPLDYYKNVKGYDWQDIILRTALTNNHSISLTGGTKSTKYAASLSYMNQDGIVHYSKYDRYQGRFSLDQTLGNKVKTGLTGSFSRTHKSGYEIGSGGIMYTIWAYRPVYTDDSLDILNMEFDDEVSDGGRVRMNPWIQLQNTYHHVYSRQFTGNAYLSWEILKGLTLKSTIGVTYATNQTDDFYNSKTDQGRVAPGNLLGVYGTKAFSEGTTLTNDNTITYKVNFKKHALTTVAGFTQQHYGQGAYSFRGADIANEELGINALEEGEQYKILSNSTTEYALQSFLMRAIYSYDSKYDLTLSGRTDGSSRFTTANRWGYFYSGAFAYRLSREKFMKQFSWLDDAKIRIGYGLTGNNGVGNYSYLPLMGFTGFYYSFGDNVPTQGAKVTSVGNSKLKWETTEQINGGLDLSLYKGRISLTVDLYNKITRDLLLNAKLPASTGYTTAYRNVGKVQNSGLEITLNTVNISKKDWQWSSNFNISFNRNKVLGLSEGQESLTTSIVSTYGVQYIAKVGYPISMIYGAVNDGLYQLSDFDLNVSGTYVLKQGVPSQSTTANRVAMRPGYEKFVDQNGDFQINIDDLTIIGNPNPDFIGGFTNNLQYKGFDLNVFFTFSYGNDMVNYNKFMLERGTENTNQLVSYANRWSLDNQDTDVPRSLSVTNMAYISNRIVEDASYLRLKNVSLGYTLPARLSKTISASQVRFYVSGQNLWTLTGYSGPDPTVSTRNTSLTRGWDYSAYPVARTITLGAQVTF
ncbi:MAG: SusC/RagA family TonB-linked outer membrane protein [Mangrovibacterium sp.]